MELIKHAYFILTFRDADLESHHWSSAATAARRDMLINAGNQLMKNEKIHKTFWFTCCAAMQWQSCFSINLHGQRSPMVKWGMECCISLPPLLVRWRLYPSAIQETIDVSLELYHRVSQSGRSLLKLLFPSNPLHFGKGIFKFCEWEFFMRVLYVKISYN